MRLGFIKSIFQKVDAIVTGRGRIDEELFEELEELLLQADVNVHTTGTILKDLRLAVQDSRMVNSNQVLDRLRADMAAVFLGPNGKRDLALRTGPTDPTFYLIVGVNG